MTLDKNGKPLPELLTYADVARLYRCSVRTVRRDVERGSLPRPDRKPGRVRFFRAEVEADLLRRRARRDETCHVATS